MAIGYLFGECGCCRGALSVGAGGEFQEVFAAIKYPMGNVGYGEPSGGNIVPARCFRGQSEEQINTDGTVVWRSGLILQELDGSGDDDGSFDHRTTTPFNGSGATTISHPTVTEELVTYANGALIRRLRYLPYAYEQAVANVVAMLDKVTLLDPLATYTSWMDGVDFHFCYPSEAAGYGYNPNFFTNSATLQSFFLGAAPHCLSRVYLTWQLTRDYLGGGLGYGPVKSQAIVCAPNSQLDGQPNGPVLAQAIRGMSYKGGSPAIYNGYIWASKSAARIPYDLTRRVQWIWNDYDQGLPQYNAIGARYVADQKPAGETIFLPADVPGFGECWWDNNPMPVLP